MREYGQVQSAFWQAADVQGMTDTGKLLALYLLTGPHANGVGCYRLPDGYVTADLEWSAERLDKGFQELSRNGFAHRFEGVVFTPNFLRWNAIANGNVAKARFKEWESLPKSELKAHAARAMLKFCPHWSDEARNSLETVSETVTETIQAGYANQNPTLPDPTQTQPRPTLPQNPPKPPKAEKPAAGFEDQFWPAYPRKVGKADAAKAFAKLRPDADLLGVMLRSLATQMASEDWRREGGRFVPHPATWLNGKRWQDDVTEGGTPHGNPWGDGTPDYLADVL